MSEVSDSDGGSLLSGDESCSTNLQKIANKCIAMKPNIIKQTKSKATSKLRDKLGRFSQQNKSRTSQRIESRKQMDDHLRELASDFLSLSKKLDTIMECFHGVFDQLDLMEDRLNSFEDCAKKPPSYSEVLTSSSAEPRNETRLDRLEYQTSEQERSKKRLEVRLTHPSIDKNSASLKNSTKDFLSSHMNMSSREIDTNMEVRKLPRENTVLLVLSDLRFKRFIYAARKKLRANFPDRYESLYINENLTNYNYSFLKFLKDEKKRRTECEAPIVSVYSFDGKVFVKSGVSDTAVHISNRSSLKSFLSQLGPIAVAGSDTSRSAEVPLLS